MGINGVEANKMPELSLHKSTMSYPEKRRDEEKDDLESSLETPRCLNPDMLHLKDDGVKTKKKTSPNTKIYSSLKQEILRLEKKLKNQFEVRCALEKALGYRSSSHVNDANEISMPKPATELIKEIAVLEVEVVHLEQYLLSLYRQAFDQQPTVSPSTKDMKRPKTPLRSDDFTVSTSQNLSNPLKEPCDVIGREELGLDSGVHRCHSSLSQRSAFSNRTSPPLDALARAVRACHSQPLSMMEYAENNSSNIISLAEHLGTRISDHVPDTPNRISEDMIKCMSAIYCKLADPPLTNDNISSPNSSLSSLNAFSPHGQCDMWSPGLRKESSFDVRLDNPFHVEGLKEFSGPYSTMVEIPCIHRDGKKMGDIEHLLQDFRSLITRLEEVDPRKMNHEEKLAFWINIHNALVMHAFLAYGIPQNSVKRVFQFLKAAYNIGGHTISADKIQSLILGCRMSRPGQWLRLILSRKTKFDARDERKSYVIDHPEPLLHFALCSGSHSDPAVRMYTPKRIFQELEAAKEEYIRATFGIRKDKKVILPKIVESFAKDSGLCPAGVIDMIQQSMPESLRKSIKKSQLGKSRKGIEWIPHNFNFRYLISNELVK